MTTEQMATFQVNGVTMCTPKSFADAHAIPIQTVYSAAGSGRITAHKHGGRLYLVASSADTYAQLYKATKGTS